MASATYDFTQANGAFSLSGATKTSYGGAINVASNAIAVTAGADETAYLLPFVAAELNIGADADFSVTVNYNKSLTLFIGDFGGGGSGPRGYAVCYRDNGGPVLRLFRCTGRYGIDTVADISVAASTTGKIGIDWVINAGVSTVVRVWFNGAVVHTFTDTAAPVQLATGTARAGFIQDYSSAGGTLDNLFVTDSYGIDSTEPAVSSVSGTGTSSSTADLTATINEVADVYFYVSNSATPPSQSNHLDGTGAAAFDVVLDAPSGAVTGEASGLSAGNWYLHVRAVDTAGNVSSVSTSAAFALTAAINITGVSGSLALGGSFSASVLDAGSPGSATLARGVYIETLTVNSWGATVQMTRPSVAAAKLLPSPVVDGSAVADAVLTLTNAAGQSSIFNVAIPAMTGRDYVHLTSVAGAAWIGVEPGQPAIAVGDAVVFTPVLYQSGVATAYDFAVAADGSPSSDTDAPAGTYTAQIRIWDATNGGFGDEEAYTLTNGGPVVVDTTPNQFVLTDLPGAELATQCTSNAVTIGGMSAGAEAPASVAGGTMSVSTDGGLTWGGFSSASQQVQNGHQIRVSGQSASGYSQPVSVLLTVGGVSDTYTITTRAAVTPILTGAAAARGSSTRVDWSVSTSYGGGVLRVLISQNAVETAQTVKTSGVAVSISGVGQKTGSFTAATGQTFYVHFVHVGEVDSAVARSQSVTVDADPVVTIQSGTVVNQSGTPISKTYSHFVLVPEAVDIDAALKAGTAVPVVSSGAAVVISGGGGSVVVPGAQPGTNYTLVLFSGETGNYKSSYVRVAVTAEAG